MRRNKGLVTLSRSRIISAAQGHPGQHLAHLLQQLFTLRPACMLDDYPRGITVEARVVSKHGIDVLGLVGQVTGPPYARRRKPGSTSARKPSAINGPKYAFTGFALYTTTWSSTNSLYSTSIGPMLATFPAPSTSATLPSCCLSR